MNKGTIKAKSDRFKRSGDLLQSWNGCPVAIGLSGQDNKTKLNIGEGGAFTICGKIGSIADAIGKAKRKTETSKKPNFRRITK